MSSNDLLQLKTALLAVKNFLPRVQALIDDASTPQPIAAALIEIVAGVKHLDEALP